MADTQENHKPNIPSASKQPNNQAILSTQEWFEVVNAINDVFLVISPEFTVLEINNYGLELFNKQRREVIGEKCYKVFDDCKEPGEDCPLLRSLESQNNELGEKYFPDKQKWFSVKSTPVVDEKGTIVKFVDLMRDITDQKSMEEELKQSELKYRFLFDRAEMLISVFNRDGSCQMVNQKVADLFGREPAAFIGKSFTDFYPGEGEGYNQRIQEVFESGVMQHYEDKVSFRGKERWLYSSLQPIKNEDGITTLVQVISYDITKQKTAELEIKKREGRQRTMISNISDVIAILNKEGIITYKSPNIKKWFGWNAEELIGKPAWEKVHKDDIPWLKMAFVNLLKKKDASEKFIYRY